MLQLVLADRYGFGPVEQDVGGLEDRVVQQPREHALLARRLVLVLRLPFQLAERCDGVEYPLQLGVLGNHGLDEERTFLRVQSGGEKRNDHVRRATSEIVGLVAPGDGVVVDYAVDALVLVL